MCKKIIRALARDLGRYVYALVSFFLPLEARGPFYVGGCSKHRLSQDLRNHGESPHDKRHDYTAMAEDVAHFIRENGLKESSVIGHSM